MSEIQVNIGDADNAFSDLRDSIGSFSEISQEVPASNSDLKTIEDLREIQDIYYEKLKAYLDVLERVEEQARIHIKDMEDTDKQLSQQSK